jgi:hypothetical protein
MYEDSGMTYAEPAQYGPEAGGEAPFGTGISGDVGGNIHIDGTPFRLATFVIAGILILVVFNQGGFRWHVTV